MQSPARRLDRFPIPPHSSAFPAPAFNLKLSTVDFLLTPLFVALPSISRVTPLSTAFTHFDGVWGSRPIFLPDFPLTTTHYPLSALLCFQHLTNPSALKASADRFVTPSVSITSELLLRQILCFHNDLRCPLVFPSIDVQPHASSHPSQCFHQLTNSSSFAESVHSKSTAELRIQRNRTPLVGPSGRLALADTNDATYNLPPSISGAHYGCRQKQQSAEIRQQAQWQTQRQTEICSTRTEGPHFAREKSLNQRCAAEACGAQRQRSTDCRPLERGRVFLSFAEIYWAGQPQRSRHRRAL